MKENIYNCYYFVEGNVITHLGVKESIVSGTDKEKLQYLKSNIRSDLEVIDKYPVPKSICNEKEQLTVDHYSAMIRVGRSNELFEEVFQILSASQMPLFVSTPVVDGELTYDIQAGHGALFLSKHQEEPKLREGVMNDYLEEYLVDGYLDIPQLIHNEHYVAIKLLFNNGHYLSAMKLLVSFIDTMGYLDFGKSANVFIQWLKKYAKLDSIDITEEELWEFRNSLLHMTNLDSRKVEQGKVERVSFMVTPTRQVTFKDHDTKYFDFMSLVVVVKEAMERWMLSYNEVEGKLVEFVKRYDRVIADSRYAKSP